VKIFRSLKFFFENRGKSETEGNCIMTSGGMDAPDYRPSDVTNVLQLMELSFARVYSLLLLQKSGANAKIRNAWKH